MTETYEKLKDEIVSWYPDETFTDAELNKMTNDLIKFFAIAAKAVQRAKRKEQLMKVHNARKCFKNNNST